MLHEIEPHKLHIEYEPRKVLDTDFVIAVKGGRLLAGGDSRLVLPKAEAFNKEDLQYLFRIDETSFWKYNKDVMQIPEGFEFKNPRLLRNMEPQWMTYGALLGTRLFLWYDGTKYCGRCGERLVHSGTERAMVCPQCNNTLYPVISPCVIVLVKDKNRAVLTRYKESRSEHRDYALIAGFVESGESFEDAVKREVKEEVGLNVTNIRFYKDQPWPLTGTILAGFSCELDGDDTIVREEDELAEAFWMEREDFPEIVSLASLTSEMMNKFKKGEL